MCACLVLVATPLQAQKVKLLVPLDSLVARAQRDSNDAPAHYEVALGYWLVKQYDLAEKHLREAIAIEPKTATAYLALSYLPFARNYGLPAGLSRAQGRAVLQLRGEVRCRAGHPQDLPDRAWAQRPGRRRDCSGHHPGGTGDAATLVLRCL